MEVHCGLGVRVPAEPRVHLQPGAACLEPGNSHPGEFAPKGERWGRVVWLTRPSRDATGRGPPAPHSHPRAGGDIRLLVCHPAPEPGDACARVRAWCLWCFVYSESSVNGQNVSQDRE